VVSNRTENKERYTVLKEETEKHKTESWDTDIANAEYNLHGRLN